MRARDNVYIRMPADIKDRLAKESFERDIPQQQIVITALRALFFAGAVRRGILAEWDKPIKGRAE